MSRPGIRSSGNLRHLAPGLWDGTFLRACRGEPTTHTPVWLMRQAGRYMAHYRGIRAAHGFLDVCKNPALAAEVTVFARDFLDVDAAIIFSDILVVLETLGLPLEFTSGDGPVLGRPIREPEDVLALVPARQAADDLAFVSQAIRLGVAGLPAHIPMIGFSGAPFTLAAYAIEGGSSRQFARTKTFMYHHAEAWHRLCGHLVDTLIPYLTAQVEAGASCLQIFDSWVGQLTRSNFIEFVQPHLQRLVAGLPAGVPVILFGTGTGHLLDLLSECGADVIGLDSSCALAASWSACGGSGRVSIQGNLDPALLLAPKERLLAGAGAILSAAAGQHGHIFNLGHGVLKETDPDQAKALVEYVHARSSRAI